MVGEPVPGWLPFELAYDESSLFIAHGETRSSDPCCSTSRAARPRSRSSSSAPLRYPVGHLSTMYWIGLREGDVHLNISSPGWAKHAWSSFFAAFNAGATVFVHNYARFVPRATLEMVARHDVTTMCAPPPSGA